MACHAAALAAACAFLLVGTSCATSLRPTKSFGGRVGMLTAQQSSEPDIVYRNGWVMGDADVIIIWWVAFSDSSH
jgi:hypothetical protein